jgi:hypothetical protein
MSYGLWPDVVLVDLGASTLGAGIFCVAAGDVAAGDGRDPLALR